MDSFLETLKELGPARLGIMGATIFVLLLFFVFISMRVTVPEMQLLYSDLSTVTPLPLQVTWRKILLNL